MATPAAGADPKPKPGDGREAGSPIEDENGDAQKRDWIWTFYVPIAVAFLVIFCAGLMVYHGWKVFVDTLFTAVEASEHRALQALVINSVLVIMTVCCLPGPSFCIILDGFFFGFIKGFVLGFTAELIAYLLCICLARSCFKSSMRQWMAGNTTLRETLMVCEDDPTGKFLVLFRFISLPVWAKNYAIGMLDIEWLKAVLIFIPAETFYAGIFAYIGSKSYTIADAIRKGDTKKAMDSFSGAEVAMVGVSMLCMALVIVFGWREYSLRRGALAEGARGESAPLAAASKAAV